MVDVFVSTDPEDLPPGDPWVETILANLALSKLVLVLATERSINRRWVWFETGAGWVRDRRVIPCCLGKTRKGQLVAPFSSFQGLNIDEEDDLNTLIGTIAKQFGPSDHVPNLREVTSALTRLDVRAEERERVKTPSFDAGTRKVAEEGWAKLNPEHKEAIRLLFTFGDLSDKQALDRLHAKGMASNWGAVFHQIAQDTAFVQRGAREPHEHVHGYLGLWTINPKFKAILEQLASGNS